MLHRCTCNNPRSCASLAFEGEYRTLAFSANEDLCFNVELPSSTDNTFQGLTTTATFNFQAEQTVNNP